MVSEFMGFHLQSVVRRGIELSILDIVGRKKERVEWFAARLVDGTDKSGSDEYWE